MLGSGVTNPSASDELLWLLLYPGLCELASAAAQLSGASWLVGLLGAAILFLYGIVPTYQPAHFGRAYAAYGGVFVLLAILWGWGVDRIAPDRWDVLGGALCLGGVAMIMYWPR